MKDTFKINAVWDENHYTHFGIQSSLASMYGDDPDDIETLVMKISDDQSIPEPNGKYTNADYWGWLDKEDGDMSMIYAQRFLLDMCFPAGIGGTEDAGQGKAYRLNVIEGEHKN